MDLMHKEHEPVRPAVGPSPSGAPAPAAALRPLRPQASSLAIRRTVRDDQICVLTFDRPDSSANFFDRATLEELRQEIDFVAGATQLKGLILASAKPAVFIAGADLHMMKEGTPPNVVRELIMLGQTLLSRIAALPVPTVAAIRGAAYGGGYELALACDYRIASPDRSTKIALPETSLGLLPAWGGATRLPRLIGLHKALDVILGGKPLAAKQALKLGMLDDIVPAERLIEVAVEKIRRGKPRHRNHWLANNPLTAAFLAGRARAKVMQKTRGHYPAVLKALEVMTRGAGKSIDASLALECEGVLALVQTEACHNLIRLFFLQERAKKRTLAGNALQLEPKAISRVAVMGAGVMGAGIAQCVSARSLPVILRDIDTAQVGKGMATIAGIYQDGVKRRVFTPLEARNGLDRIFPAPTEVPLKQVDLVIEAAVENLELKRKIFRRLDELAGHDTILATNTSALPVSELAGATSRPGRVLGLHFFNPVHRMQLVEVVAARQTMPEVLRCALRFVQQIGKLPVVVKDSPGFLVNRILMPYLVEAGSLFEAGASPADLDNVMLDFGMPMGPMRLLDEVGLDVALHVTQTLAVAFGDRLKVPELLGKMAGAGLLGRKSRRGFYLHDKSMSPRPNPAVSAYVKNQSARAMAHEELQERMVLLMVNEAARCLEEQIVAEPADVDFAMIMGAGFAPFRGGPLRYADFLGAEKIVGAMEHLVDGGAAHFEPCALLRDMGRGGRKFHARE
jgi:3-hydroxyacyl-CoA dehydrogenase / enoyl-CoA hydratase / 3-hydroxybutyryl-CoA epimerase